MTQVDNTAYQSMRYDITKAMKHAHGPKSILRGVIDVSVDEICNVVVFDYMRYDPYDGQRLTVSLHSLPNCI